MASPFVRPTRPSDLDRGRRPLLQFMVVGIIGMLAIGLAGYVASRRAGEAEAMNDMRERTKIVANTVVEPNLSVALLEGDPAALDALDAIVAERVLFGSTVRVKLWDARGRVVYSDEPRLIGEEYPLDEDKRASLWSGAVVSEISSVDGPENRFESGNGDLLEVYFPIDGPDGEPLLYESYFDTSEVNDSSNRILRAFVPIMLVSLVLMQAMHLLLAWALDRQLSRARVERERLLQRAIEASDTERRRIAADLHDGVVQDLAGTSFAIAAAAETAAAESSVLAADLRSASVGTRRSLQSLRTLLVDIYPPNLETNGLLPALTDVLAPANALGIETELIAPDRVDLPLDISALVYRVVHEAVRNVIRHADATTLRVTIEVEPRRVVAVVADDGRGFRPSDPSPGGHLGLRVMSDLTADAGAHLRIVAEPGAGSTVTLEVPR